jgi:DNA-binding NarL/FixJ family response regulator
MRVAIAEDSVLLREGLARLLGDAGFEVVAQCGTADELLLKARSYPLDVAIVDIACLPRTTTKAYGRHSRFGQDIPKWGSSSFRSTSSWGSR